MADDPFRFERPARRPTGIALVAAGVMVLLFLVFAVGAHPLIVAALALVIAPAVWDIARDSRATFEIADGAIAWQSGRRGGRADLARLDEAKLATTLDFSQRLTLLMKDGTRVRVPPECLPGGRVLDAEFTRRGIPNRRSLFSF